MFWTPSAWQWGSGWPSEPAVPGSNLNEARSAESDMHKLMRWKGSKGVIETTFIVRYSHLDTKRGILTYYVFPAPRIPSEHRWKSLSQLSSCRHLHHCRSCHGRHSCHRCVSCFHFHPCCCSCHSCGSCRRCRHRFYWSQWSYQFITDLQLVWMLCQLPITWWLLGKIQMT